MGGQGSIILFMALKQMAAVSAAAALVLTARGLAKERTGLAIALKVAAAGCVGLVLYFASVGIIDLKAARREQLRQEAPARATLLCGERRIRTEEVVLCMEINRLKAELADAKREAAR